MEAYRLENNNLALLIDHYQSKLLPYAYNIVGDLMEAEDIVQEVLNKHFLASHEHVEKPDNYLIRSVINRAINQKQLLRNRREQYPGKWLPSPVLTEEDIYSKVDRNQILNYSLLVLLEHLSPKERAVFILKETFDFSHGEISDILDINIEHSRQLLKRARLRLEPVAHQSPHVANESQEVLHQLTDAILQADIEKVKHLLSADVQSLSDGGPKARAARNTIIGPERVYKFLKAIYGKYLFPNTSSKFTTVNHKPAIIFSADGAIFRCMVFEMNNNTIEKIFIMVNPDKLQGLKYSG